MTCGVRWTATCTKELRGKSGHERWPRGSFNSRTENLTLACADQVARSSYMHPHTNLQFRVGVLAMETCRSWHGCRRGSLHNFSDS
jgi:hypothetical protein